MAYLVVSSEFYESVKLKPNAMLWQLHNKERDRLSRFGPNFHSWMKSPNNLLGLGFLGLPFSINERGTCVKSLFLDVINIALHRPFLLKKLDQTSDLMVDMEVMCQVGQPVIWLVRQTTDTPDFAHQSIPLPSYKKVEIGTEILNWLAASCFLPV